MDNIRNQLQSMPNQISISKPDTGVRTVRTKYYGLKKAPSEFRFETNAGIVFYYLNRCYGNQENICEGVVEDVMWGFLQEGIPKRNTYQGFQELKKHGYMNFTDKNRIVVFSDDIHELWYKWTQKFYDLLIDDAKKIAEGRPLDVLMKPGRINYMDIK